MNSTMNYGNKTNSLQSSETYTQKCLLCIEISDI